MTRYQLTIEAENLPLTSLWSRWVTGKASEAYAEVVVTGGPKQGTKIGQTEQHSGRSIAWTKTLFLETDASMYMPLAIRVYKDNGALLGEMTAEATAIYQSPGRIRTEKTTSGIRYVYECTLELYGLADDSVTYTCLMPQYFRVDGRIHQGNVVWDHRHAFTRTRYQKCGARIAWPGKIRSGLFDIKEESRYVCRSGSMVRDRMVTVRGVSFHCQTHVSFLLSLMYLAGSLLIDPSSL